MMIEIHTCPLCRKNNTHQPYLSARDALVSGETFTITSCSACGLMITNPRPDDTSLLSYYKSANYVSHTDARRNMREILYAWVKGLMIRRKTNWIKNHLQLNKPALLDYGCGTGEFVLHAGKQGFRTFGVEPNRDARERALEKGAKVHPAIKSLENQGSFDVITLWHVLEHLPDVPEMLQQLYGKLNDNGLLVVAVPMATSHDAIRYKSDWAAWDLPRHLCHFTPETLHAMLSQQKLEYVATYPLPFDAWYVALLSEQQKQNPTGTAWSKVHNALPFRILRAACTATVSNCRARRKKTPWSSQVFIYRKYLK